MWIGASGYPLMVVVDGASGDGPRLKLRLVPVEQARALHDQLSRTLARRRLRW